LIVPYYDVTTFYKDYIRYMASISNEVDNDTAVLVSETTFRRAFIKKKDIRLLGSKGAFHTCEICNNALDLLHDTSNYFHYFFYYNIQYICIY
jgi:hypothetical protein